MSATTEQAPAVRRSADSRLLTAMPAWAGVGISRLVILAAGVSAALFGTRYQGWAQFDPGRTTAHLGTLGNLLAAAADRWDSIHYLQIAQHGYVHAPDASFFPLYPMLVRVVGAGFGSDVIAGVAISGASFVIAMVLLHRLVCEEFGRETAQATVLLLAFAPLSFYFTAVYTESLFLALSVGAFYAARKERWLLAALLAAVDSVARVPGIIVIVPVAYMWWYSPARPRRALAWFALAPLPLIAYSFYLEARGWGLLAPITNESAWSRGMGGPIVTIIDAVKAAISTPAYPVGVGTPLEAPTYNLLALLLLWVAVATLVGAWRRLPKEYAIYATLLLIVAVWSPVPITPLKSVDRYVLTIFPLWIFAAMWLKQHRLLTAILAVELIGLIFYTHQFALWSFVA